MPVYQLITGIFLWLSAVYPPLFSAFCRLFWRTNGGQITGTKPSNMRIEISCKASRNGEKIWWTIDGAMVQVKEKRLAFLPTRHLKAKFKRIITNKSQLILGHWSLEELTFRHTDSGTTFRLL